MTDEMISPTDEFLADARHDAIGMMTEALRILDDTGPHHAAATLSRALELAGGDAPSPKP